MSVKIITKHETGGTGDEPLSTDLEKGELGVNTVDGKLWVGDGASKKLLTPSGGLVDGLADGNTLRWEDSASEWQATSALVVDDAGNVTATGDLTAASFIGDGSQLTNVPGATQWDDVTGGINYADGSVGIGTTNPVWGLNVEASTQTIARFQSTSGTSAIIEVGPTSVTGTYPRIQGMPDGSINLLASGFPVIECEKDEIRFKTNSGTERMRIDTSGNVKINTGNLELSGGGGWYQTGTTWTRSLNDVAVYTGNTAATAFATPGDFTAGYSDMRLKTHLGTIPDALDKVCSLEGFYYERNDTAVELGYTGGERRVGLSAQDVQAVLPEVVKDAPINIDHGTDYLTIDYERVVPLLVESIKDLRAEIDELKRNQK